MTQALTLDDLVGHGPDQWQWHREGLSKRFEFPNRRACAAFTQALMDEANRVNHHPDLAMSDNGVLVTFITHATESVTDKDYEGAKFADEAAGKAALVLSSYRERLLDLTKPRSDYPGGRYPSEGDAKERTVTPTITDEDGEMLYDYAGRNSEEINRFLRTGQPFKNATMTPQRIKSMKLEVKAKALDSIIQKSALPVATTLYRGVSSKDLAKAQVGDVLVDKGFMSTTTKQSVAKTFALGKNAVVLEIKAPAGHPAISMTMAKHVDKWGQEWGYRTQGGKPEHELLLPRGGQFVVTARNGNRLTVRPK